MPVPTDISQLSQTAGSNSPAGSESPTTADDYFRTYASYIALLRDGKGFSDELDVASAGTTDIGAVNSLIVRITGTTTITSLGTTYNGPRIVRFADILTLTHNASTLVLPGAANITTAAGDAMLCVPNGSTPSGWRVLIYQRAGGVMVIPGAVTSSGLTMATARMLGRLTASTGAIEELTSAQVTSNFVDAATTATAGKVELATDAEAPDRTKTAVVLTPATLRDALVAQNDAPIYACRAWVNFNGTGTVAIRASGNVSSITDNGTGDYTVNFTTAMPDANYAVVGSSGANGLTSGSSAIAMCPSALLAGSVRVVTTVGGGSANDRDQMHVAIFR